MLVSAEHIPIKINPALFVSQKFFGRGSPLFVTIVMMANFASPFSFVNSGFDQFSELSLHLSRSFK